MTEAQTPALEACPFCGGEAAIILEHRTWVECLDCPSRANLGPFDTKAEAIAAWNTSAKPALEPVADSDWHSADTPAIEGVPVLAEFYEYNNPSGTLQHQFVVWHKGGWRTVFDTNATAYVERWRYLAHPTADRALLDEVREAVSFLLDRLVDHENRIMSEDDARDFHGHIIPAMARFRAILAKLEALK